MSDVRFSLWSAIKAITTTAIFLGVISYLHQLEIAKQAERTRLTNLDDATRKVLVEQVEEIRVRLGRAPNDEAELEQLLGTSMPVVHDKSFSKPVPTAVHYHRTAKNSYKLQYEIWSTDDWIFDSTNPTAGWVNHYY